jgi:alpha-ribazole phosphatase
MNVWVARHARPLVAEGLCYGATDVRADAAETAQAAAVLARNVPTGVACFCSPLVRCRDLAAALEASRPDLRCSLDPRLAEMDFGCWEGVPWSTIPRADFERWNAEFAVHRFGGRESVAELLARVAAALAEVRAGGRDALWITHAGVARALQLLSAGIAPRTPADWPREALAFGAVRCVSLP